jgi:hypothetical protein
MLKQVVHALPLCCEGLKHHEAHLLSWRMNDRVITAPVFALRIFWVKISATTLAVLTEDFRSFNHSSEKKCWDNILK